MIKVRCDLCRIVIVGKPVRYAHRNFCCERHKGDWEDYQIRSTTRKFAHVNDANEPQDYVGKFQE